MCTVAQSREKVSDLTKLSLTVTLPCTMLKYSNMDRTVALQTPDNFCYKSYLIISNSRKNPKFTVLTLAIGQKKPPVPKYILMK